MPHSNLVEGPQPMEGGCRYFSLSFTLLVNFFFYLYEVLYLVELICICFFDNSELDLLVKRIRV